MKFSNLIKTTSIIFLVVTITTVFGFYYLGQKQYDLPVVYYINLNGTPDCEGEFQAIQNSFQTWENVKKSYMDFTYGDKTPISYIAKDGVDLLVWIENNWPEDPWAIAFNQPYYLNDDPSTGILVENDIAFNGQYFTWSTSTPPPSDRMDVQNIATHEIGHSLMLGDLYESWDTEKTMYGYADTSETKKRDLEPDDKDGIIYIYETLPPPWLIATAKKGGMAKLSTPLAEVWRVELDWEHSLHYGVSHYKVYRAESGTPFTHIGTSYGADNTFYVDNDVQEGHTYYYKLKTVNFKYGESDFGPTANVYVGEGGAKIAADDFALIAPYPNPFNTTTVIGYQIPKLSNVSLKIYNQMGQLVRTLKDGHNDLGYHRVVWDGKDNFGKDVASGLYLYRFKADDYTAIGKLMLLR